MKKIIGILLAASFLFSCTHVYTRKGMYYRVEKGETLKAISNKYRVDLQELAEVNNIDDPEQLREGRSIYIPGMTPKGLSHLIEKNQKQKQKEKLAKASKSKFKTGKSKSKANDETPKEEAPTSSDSIRVERGRFIWPINGEISSPFGMRHGRRHDGIDIRSPIGKPIIAAAAGEVVFSKRMRGYGNLVLLKHKDDFFTVYAHNSVNIAKLGQKVKSGQLIAKVGRTGRATGPHLHFEVREGTKSRNPLFFLPKNEFAKKLNFENDPSSNIQEEDHSESDEEDGPDGAEPVEKVEATKAKPVVVKEVKAIKAEKPAAKPTVPKAKTKKVVREAPKPKKTVKTKTPVKKVVKKPETKKEGANGRNKEKN